jgi:hypothetical protein
MKKWKNMNKKWKIKKFCIKKNKIKKIKLWNMKKLYKNEKIKKYNYEIFKNYIKMKNKIIA